MTEKEKYVNAFCNVFDIEEEKVLTLKYREIPDWDSIGHMSLVAEIEKIFDITLETEDIVDFKSFDEGIKLLRKYQIMI